MDVASTLGQNLSREDLLRIIVENDLIKQIKTASKSKDEECAEAMPLEVKVECDTADDSDEYLPPQKLRSGRPRKVETRAKTKKTVSAKEKIKYIDQDSKSISQKNKTSKKKSSKKDKKLISSEQKKEPTTQAEYVILDL